MIRLGEKMIKVWIRVGRLVADNFDGASMVEYAFLIGLIALAVIAGAVLIGSALSGDFSDVGTSLQGA